MKSNILSIIMVSLSILSLSAKSEVQCIDTYQTKTFELALDFKDSIDKDAEIKLDRLKKLLVNALGVESSNLSLMSEFLTTETKKIQLEIVTSGSFEFSGNERVTLINQQLDTAQKRIQTIEQMSQELPGIRNIFARKTQGKLLKTQIKEILASEKSSQTLLSSVADLLVEPEANLKKVDQHSYVLAKEVEKMEKLIETILTTPIMVKESTSVNFMLEHLMTTITSLNQTLVSLAATKQTLIKQISLIQGLATEVNQYGVERLNALAKDSALVKSVLDNVKKEIAETPKKLAGQPEVPLCLSGGICAGTEVVVQISNKLYKGVANGVFPSGNYSVKLNLNGQLYEITRSNVSPITFGSQYANLTVGDEYNFKIASGIYSGKLMGVFPNGDVSAKLSVNGEYYRVGINNVAKK